MSRRTFATLTAGAILVAAACSSSGGTSSSLAPSSAPPDVRSVAPSATPVASICAETTDAGEVAVSIKDFEFEPATIAARTGQVVAFTNTGFESHNATPEAGGCGTRTLGTGERDGLVFAVVGRYPFHCTVHPWMTGTFTIAG